MHFSTFPARETAPDYLTPPICAYRDFTIVFQGESLALQKHGDRLATQYILLQINAFKYQIHSIQHPSANNAAYFASVYIIRLE